MTDVSGAPALTLPEAVPYDIQADRDRLLRQLQSSEEIDALTSQIDAHDMNSIVTFGSGTAEQISQVSDAILRTMRGSDMDASSKMLEALAGIMSRFDLEELRGKPRLLDRLFGGTDQKIDRLVEKYTGMGSEVDRIYVQLRRSEAELRQTSAQLEELFSANVDYFHDLEKYIVAGETGCGEIRAYLEQLREQYARTGDESLTFEIHSMQQALNMLEQRTSDLRTAEAVALQSIPMIKTMQYTNMNLVRKIDSAFIVTLPVFRQALAQAILLKRQRVQAEAMSALDRQTNELLARNARNAADGARQSARLAAESGIDADTLEKSWRTIVGGIEDTRRLQETARAERRRDEEKLEALKRDFLARQAR